MNSFQFNYEPKFRQTDAAGILFFSESFNIFHDVYEEWVVALGFEKKFWFQNQEWGVPLVKVEGHYTAPILAFKKTNVQIDINQVNNSSFSLTTKILQDEQIAALIQSTHVFIDLKNKKARPIPSEILAKLQSF